MRKYMRSSWNSDRVAGSILNKEKKPRTASPKSEVREYKVKDLYPKLYGREAYEAWCDREAEIDACMHAREARNKACVRGGEVFDVLQIISLRQTSFRMMKAGCDQHDLNLDEIGNIVIRPRSIRAEKNLRLAA